MAQGLLSDIVPALPAVRDEEDMATILTKTIIPSPVIRWILHARIRRSAWNDVVFVGDDFIHIKQVKDDGTIQHIATKNNFDGEIRAANVFKNRKEHPNEDFFLTAVNGEHADGNDILPPQCLVLALSSNDLVFIWLATNEDGSHRFVQQSCPLPAFDKALYQPGQHLAVDPQSRAIAVAAYEREVVLYSAKSKEKIQSELRDGRSDWCPVSASRPLQIHGTIQHLDFLIPPTDDQGWENEDYIILLLIVVDEGKTRAIRIEWQASSDLHHARIHTGQPLDVKRTVPSLLIPLRNAAFLLANGSEIKLWRDILTGSATSRVMEFNADAPNYQGASPRHPLWVNWCRPIRGHHASKDIDYIYLIREDGELYLLQVTLDGVGLSNAGAFGCHVSSAFASLGDSISPDIIVAAGDMSSGSAKSIGKWFTAKEVPQLNREDWAEMGHIETIRNWASNTDLVVSSLSGRSQRSRDGIFVTSGRQPYGAITELRSGLEASISEYVESDIMRSVTDIWSLPCPTVGNVLTLLSSPGGTRIFDIHESDEKDGNDVSLDTDYKTLAAKVTREGKIIQITERTLRVSLGTPANFEDCARIQIDETSSVIAAAIDIVGSVVITATRSTSEGSSASLHCYLLHVDDTKISGDEQIALGGAMSLDSEALCVSSFVTAASRLIALVAMANGELIAILVDSLGTMQEIARITMPRSGDGPGMCDNIVVLGSNGAALAVCGLRDGSIHTTVMNDGGPILFEKSHTISFSQTTVKLVQPPHDQAYAFAMSGLDTCLLSWNGEGADTLEIQNIWMTDRERPELSQGPIIACTTMPPAEQVAAWNSGSSFIAVAGDELWIATLKTVPAVVPRQMAVSGTPSRLIYSEQYRCLVCASQHYSSKSKGTRVIQPVIDFIPLRSNASTFAHTLQSLDRVYALLEWSWTDEERKTYSFILAGGSYTKSSGSQRGRVIFLQPNFKHSARELREVEVKILSFEEPVYALALDAKNTRMMVSTGRNIVVWSYQPGPRRWRQASQPLKLRSPGIYVTVSPDNNSVQVSTLSDGLVSLEVVDDEKPDGEYDIRLAEYSMLERAEDSLSHIPLNRSKDGVTVENGTVVMSTKDGRLLGLRPRAPPGRESYSQTQVAFEAVLPRSLTRLRQCNIRPRWKAARPDGINGSHDMDVIGCSADGSVIGLSFLDEQLWHQLNWLQRLCEWSPILSPHSHDDPPYSVGDQTHGRYAWPMPVGFTKQRRHDVVTRTDEMADMDEEAPTPPQYIQMRTWKTRPQGRHIDGDVLGRLLKQKDPAATLRQILGEVADPSRTDTVAKWVREHYQQEMARADEAINLLKRVLDDWM